MLYDNFNVIGHIGTTIISETFFIEWNQATFLSSFNTARKLFSQKHPTAAIDHVYMIR